MFFGLEPQALETWFPAGWQRAAWSFEADMAGEVAVEKAAKLRALTPGT
jgi:hypothetical protein